MKKVVLLLILALLVGGCTADTVAPASKKLPIYSVAREDNKLSISFDAAWGTEYTRDILDILDQYEIKTTFFVVQFWVEDYPEMAREIVNRGHELGNHSATHPQMGDLSAAEIEREIMATHETIREITGFEAKLFRPPFGHYSGPMLEKIESLGYYTIQWDVDSLDWKERGTEEVVQRVTRLAGPGSIVLFHNNAKYITQALPLILEDFRRRNLEVVPASELIYYEDYIIDHEGRQHRRQ
jgi:polysaccharide deacetylase family sporulation protein PdaB